MRRRLRKRFVECPVTVGVWRWTASGCNSVSSIWTLCQRNGLGGTKAARKRRTKYSQAAGFATSRPLSQRFLSARCCDGRTVRTAGTGNSQPAGESTSSRFRRSVIASRIDRVRCQIQRLCRFAQLRDWIADREKRVRAGSRAAIPTPHPMWLHLVHHRAAREDQANCRGQQAPPESSHPCVLRHSWDEPSLASSQSGGKLGQPAKPDKTRFRPWRMRLASVRSSDRRETRRPRRSLDYRPSVHHPDALVWTPISERTNLTCPPDLPL
ncbi:MAG: hypothetical protein FD138_2684 [Planctomycetota bacterium]|nr:MAG: hypothetical protein FD138_2684 [Planctomycetota bacterium]